MPLSSQDVVIVEALRTPIGRRNGGLSTTHPADLLGAVLEMIVNRTGIDPAEVGQLVGGCVSQVGEQTFNIARTAWLSAGLPLTVAATTVDSQCGSSQQATSLAASLVGGGAVDVAIGCGVETMSRVPIGAAMRSDFGMPTPKSYFGKYEMTSQSEGADRIAEKWGITREDTDKSGLLSQERAIRAWAEDRFAGQIVEIDAPDLDEEAKELKLTPKARIIDHCLVGTDPVLMLTGPIDATQRLMERNKMTVDQID